MTSFLDKLNLRPQERRLVVFVIVVVFVVVNVIWVVPQFGKVDFWGNRRVSAETTLSNYLYEVKRVAFYTNELKKLEREGVVPGTDDAILSLQKDVTSLAGMSSVSVVRSDPVQRNQGRTNSFFEEAGLRISVTTGEKELVDFLYNLGSRNNLIRVRTMSLQPDPSQTRLQGPIELVISFPKKTISKGSGRASGTAARSTAPATTPTAATTPVSTNLVKSATATAPAKTNWFKKLVARFTGGSTPTTPKTNAPATGAKSTKFVARTNAAPNTPNLPAPK